MKTFAVYNFKGGVGKTTTTVNLAYLSASEGARTLIWDLDPQGGTSFFLCIKPAVKGGGKGLLQGAPRPDPLIRATGYPNLDLLPADLSYRHMDFELLSRKKPLRPIARLLKPLSKRYDRLFLDCPPGLSTVAESVFASADVLLVPMLPSALSLRAYNKLVRFLMQEPKRRLKVLPFFNQANLSKPLHQVVTGKVLAEHPIFLRSMIPDSSVIETMGIKRSPLFTYAGQGKEAEAFRTLWEELQGRAL